MNKQYNSAKCAELLERQKERLDDARRRKGEIPIDSKRPKELIESHERASKWLSEKKSPGDTFIVDSSIIAPYYPPSTASPDCLAEMHIKDLQLETHHRGSCLLLMTYMKPIKVAGVIISLMRDEAYDMVITSHHYEDAENLNLGDIFMIKEPYFTITSDGDYCVRVDHVTDMLRVSPLYHRVSSKLRLQVGDTFTTTSDWKRKGDWEMKRKDYITADRAYASALGCNPTMAERVIIGMNRALAHLRIRSYDRVLWDLASSMVQDHPPEKALYRASQALYYLGRFRHCEITLGKLLLTYPGNEAAIREKARVEQRLLEQKSGQYDFSNMCYASMSKPLYLDHSSYVKSVKVQKSQGRGLGLFTTKNVVAGELLLCEKAFSYCYEERNAEKSEGSSEISILGNMLTNRITTGTQVLLLKETIQKLKRNPSFIPSVTALHHGSYVPIEESKKDFVDTFLIYHIVSLNTFGCPITSRDSHAYGRALPPAEVERQHSSSGLWITASRINHSCFYNARRSFIGDIQIVRAACDIPRDTEITFMYQAVGFDESDPSKCSNPSIAQTALQNWGFECTCGICTYRSTTPMQTLQYRAALLDDLELSFKQFSEVDLTKAERLLAALEKTYSVPAVEVPRLAIWQPYLFVTRQYVQQNNPEKTISTALKLLKALGFVIKSHLVAVDGQSINGWSHGSNATSRVIFEVTKWGLVVDHIIEVFMHILKACQTVQPLLCESLETVVRTAYRICVGEDETFWEKYGKFYSVEGPRLVPRGISNAYGSALSGIRFT